MTPLPSPRDRIRLIQSLVAARYGIPLSAMSSPSRLRKFARPRQLAMSLALEFTHRPPLAIGKQFGGRCRKTVFYAIQAVERRAAEDAAERLDREALRIRIRKNLPESDEIKEGSPCQMK